MIESKLRALVSEAVSIDRRIEQLAVQLKALKEQIATEAETRQEEATATEGGGTSLVFEGSDGCIARVTTAGPTLKSVIKPADKKFQKIKDAAKGFFARLFETEVVHRPTSEFRRQAIELLGSREASALIKLCETPGKTTVSFETKEPAGAEA